MFKNYHTVLSTLRICEACSSGLNHVKEVCSCVLRSCRCPIKANFMGIGMLAFSLPAITGLMAAFSQLAGFISPGLPPVLLAASFALYVKVAHTFLHSKIT